MTTDISKIGVLREAHIFTRIEEMGETEKYLLQAGDLLLVNFGSVLSTMGDDKQDSFTKTFPWAVESAYLGVVGHFRKEEDAVAFAKDYYKRRDQNASLRKRLDAVGVQALEPGDRIYLVGETGVLTGKVWRYDVVAGDSPENEEGTELHLGLGWTVTDAEYLPNEELFRCDLRTLEADGTIQAEGLGLFHLELPIELMEL